MVNKTQLPNSSDYKKKDKDPAREAEEVGYGCLLVFAYCMGPIFFIPAFFTFLEGNTDKAISILIMALLWTVLLVVLWKWREKSKKVIGFLSRAVGSIKGPSSSAISVAQLPMMVAMPLQIFQMADMTRRIKEGDDCEKERTTSFLLLLAAAFLPSIFLIVLFFYFIAQLLLLPIKIFSHKQKEKDEKIDPDS